MYPTLESNSLSSIIVSVVLRVITECSRAIRGRVLSQQIEQIEELERRFDQYLGEIEANMHANAEVAENLHRQSVNLRNEVSNFPGFIRNPRNDLEIRRLPAHQSDDDSDDASRFVKEEKEVMFKPRFKRRHLNKRFV